MSSTSDKVCTVIDTLKKNQHLQSGLEREIICPNIDIDIIDKSLYRHVTGEWIEVLCLAENKETHEVDVIYRNIKTQKEICSVSKKKFLQEEAESRLQPYTYMSKSELKDYLGTIGVMNLLQKEIFSTERKSLS